MRDTKALHPQLQQKLCELKAACEKKGLRIKIGECLRSVAEQDELYAKGRTKPGQKVTNAKGSTYSSQHQWGIAADFYIDMDVDGDGNRSDDAFNNSTGIFDRVGAIAKSVGLGWGGDWKNPVDRPHLYLPDWGSTTARLRQQYGTPEKFMKTWVKHPVFETDRTYAVTQECYLRSSAGAGSTNKIKYRTLSEALKKKCGKKAGYAVFRKNKTFRLVNVRYAGRNVWGQMKSGYWVPLVYKKCTRVKI